MATKSMTGSDIKLYMYDEFAGAEIASYPVDGGIHYIKADSLKKLDGLTVRTSETTITTTGLSDDIYTVADGTIFRVGERVPVLNGSSVRIGTVEIKATQPTGVKVEKVSEADFTLTSGDILVLEEDAYMPELGLDIIPTSSAKYALVNGDSGTKLVQHINDSDLKKKS